ncbi:MAG: B12-binding domain-containing radical SAM protein [Tissierellia bacterium]|nr:B12-binding domain-containing radical SAM protein [Tissierellia bacterium]
MFYEGRVYRPPSEARSLIIQATVGCSHNGCTFCSMYKGEPFKIKPYNRIMEDMQTARELYTHVEKMFLADGDCMMMPAEDLKKILDLAKIVFPELKQISTYGTTKSILKKSKEELLMLKEHGLDMIYLGVESGSAKVLEHVKKGVTPDEIIKSGRMVREAGIKLSVTFISGLGSDILSHEHAVESARVINDMQPDYIGLLTLLLEPHAPLYKEVQDGSFHYLEPHEVLLETKTMVENIDVPHGVFRSNHASNYVPLRGTFPDDKERILRDIEKGLSIDDATFKNKYRAL